MTPVNRTALVAGKTSSPAVLAETMGGHRANVIYFAAETRP